MGETHNIPTATFFFGDDDARRRWTSPDEILMRDSGWDEWLALPALTVRQVVCLDRNMDPEQYSRIPPDMIRPVQRLERAVEAAIAAGDLKTCGKSDYGDWYLRLREYLTWRCRDGIEPSLPPRLKSLAEAVLEAQLASHKRPDLAEKYAKAREEVLGAAVALLAKFPDAYARGSRINVAKLVRDIDDKAKLFWPDTLDMPISSDVAEDLISGWIAKAE